MKKIIIFYASYGGGHLSAAKSIENYLKKNYNDLDVELIDCIKYINECASRLRSNCNFDMTIDNLLLKMWEELNESSNRR